MLFALSPFVMLIGAISLWLGIVSYRAESGAKAEPDVVTAADLVAKGRPANRHVRLTDAAPDFKEALKLTTTYKSRRTGATNSTNESVFLPVTTAPARLGDKPALAAVLGMTPAEFEGYRGGPAQGIFSKEALPTISSEVAKRFAAIYGQDAVDKVGCLWLGGKPEVDTVTLMMIGFGIVLLAIGIFMLVKGASGASSPKPPAAAPPRSPPPLPAP